MTPIQQEPMTLGADGELPPELAQPIPAESLEALAKRAFLLKPSRRKYVIAYFGAKSKKQDIRDWRRDQREGLGIVLGSILPTLGLWFIFLLFVGQFGLIGGAQVLAAFVASVLVSVLALLSNRKGQFPIPIPWYVNRLASDRLIIGYVLPSHNRYEFDYRFTSPDGQEMIGHCIASKPREPGRRKAAPDRVADSPEAGASVVVDYTDPVIFRLL